MARTRGMVFSIVAWLIVSLTGCAPPSPEVLPPAQAAPTATPAPGDIDHGPAPAATPTAGAQGDAPAPAVERGMAYVEAIDVLLLESFPVQVHAVVRGNLPDGCTEIEGVQEEREGQVFHVTITTVRPTDLACTEALVPFEEVVPLDVVALEAGTYTVLVNGVSATFSLRVDNAPPLEVAPPKTGPDTAIDDAIVTHVTARAALARSDAIRIVIRGSLRDGCTRLVDVVPSLRARGISVDLVTERDPEAVCTQALVPFEAELVVDVSRLNAGTYEVVVSNQRASFERK